ncbi:MAG: hypothetical protein FIB01_10550 [Gemmatimonadetes bacterium]|nr:hypothetical protein [Gemmatimonadota bacterium]
MDPVPPTEEPGRQPPAGLFAARCAEQHPRITRFDGGNTHAPEEWWRDVDSHVAVQRALLILLAEAGLD